MKNYYIFISACLILSSLNLSGQTQLILDSEDILTQAPKELYSINFHRAIEDNVAADKNFKKRIDELKPTMVRYHASEMIIDGNNKNWVDFTNKSWKINIIRKVLENKPVPDDKTLITITGWPSWMDKNNDDHLDKDSYKAYFDWCAELVDIVNKTLGYNIKYWEPFNEKDGDYRGESDIKELAEIFKGCHNAMKKKDSKIKMVGGAWRQPWDTDINFFIKHLNGKYIDVWSHHQYATGGETNIETIYDRANLERGILHMRKKLDANKYSNVPIWLDEWNIYWTWNAQGHQNMTNAIGAVFDALIFKNIAEQGLTDGLFAWNAADGRYGKIKKDFSGLHLGGHLFKIFSEFGYGNVLNITSDSPKKIEGFTVKNDSNNTQMIAVINRNDTDVQVDFSANGWTPNNDNVRKYTISSSGLSTSNVSWKKDMVKNNISTSKNSITIYVSEAKGRIVDVSEDKIVSENAPSKVKPGKTYAIDVDYQAQTNREISVTLVNTKTWRTHAFKKTTVSQGANTVTLNLQVDDDTPIGKGFQWLIKIKNLTTDQQLDKKIRWATVIKNDSASQTYHFYSESGDEFTNEGGNIEIYAMDDSTISQGAPEGNEYLRLKPKSNYAKYEFELPSSSNKSSWESANLSFEVRTKQNFVVALEQSNGTRKTLELKNFMNRTGNWEQVTIPISDFGSDLTKFKSLIFSKTWKKDGDLMDVDHVRITNISNARIVSKHSSNSIKSYPNPAHNTVKIMLSSNISQAVDISITDYYGVEVLHQKKQVTAGENILEIPVKSIIEGHYLLKISMHNGSQTKKIIIAH